MLRQRASVITSNLRNLKSAVTFWYVDNQDKIVKNSTSKAYLVRYNGNESPIQEFGKTGKTDNIVMQAALKQKFCAT